MERAQGADFPELPAQGLTQPDSQLFRGAASCLCKPRKQPVGRGLDKDPPPTSSPRPQMSCLHPHCHTTFPLCSRPGDTPASCCPFSTAGSRLPRGISVPAAGPSPRHQVHSLPSRLCSEVTSAGRSAPSLPGSILLLPFPAPCFFLSPYRLVQQCNRLICVYCLSWSLSAQRGAWYLNGAH